MIILLIILILIIVGLIIFIQYLAFNIEDTRVENLALRQPKPNIIEEIIFNKEYLLDYDWLFKSVPWCNFDNECKKFLFYKTNSDMSSISHEPVEIFVIYLNGLKPTIKKFTCDSVIVSAFHATVTHFSFEFFLGGKKVGYSLDYHSFAYTEEDIKKRFIEYLESKIKGLEWQINNKKTIIESINKINGK